MQFYWLVLLGANDFNFCEKVENFIAEIPYYAFRNQIFAGNGSVGRYLFPELPTKKTVYICGEKMLPQMPRRIPTELPELDTLALADNKSSDHKTQLLLKLLRTTAIKIQSDYPFPFYSIRAVANRFDVSPATISRMYDRLKSEGVLGAAWGSRTVVQPRQSRKKNKLDAVVIPVDLTRFTASPEYQKSILEVQRELWHRGLSDHLAFFQQRDEELLDLLKSDPFHNTIAIIWLFPQSSNKQTILRLNDASFRVVCVSDTRISGVRECHLIARDRPLSKILGEEF